jgi:uncharacterized protein (TIGR03083 family)
MARSSFVDDSRGPQIARALETLADTLSTATEAQWNADSLCAGWSVKDAVAHLVWRVGSPTPQLAGDILRATVAGRTLNPVASFDGIAHARARAVSGWDLVGELRLIAEDKHGGRGRTSAGELFEVVVHGYDAAHPIGLHVPFAATSTHSVGRQAAALAGLRTRIALRSRTMLASDDGWSVGRGPVIEGTAESVILYLTGRRAPEGGRSRVLAPVSPRTPNPGLV